MCEILSVQQSAHAIFKTELYQIECKMANSCIYDLFVFLSCCPQHVSRAQLYVIKTPLTV